MSAKSLCPIRPSDSKRVKNRIRNILNKNKNNRIRHIKIDNYLQKQKFIYKIKRVGKITRVVCARWRKINVGWLFTELTFKDMLR